MSFIFYPRWLRTAASPESVLPAQYGRFRQDGGVDNDALAADIHTPIAGVGFPQRLAGTGPGCGARRDPREPISLARRPTTHAGRTRCVRPGGSATAGGY